MYVKMVNKLKVLFLDQLIRLSETRLGSSIFITPNTWSWGQLGIFFVLLLFSKRVKVQ